MPRIAASLSALALLAIVGCTPDLPTQPLADEASMPCGESLDITARSTREGDYLALAYERDSPPHSPTGVFLVSQGPDLVAITVKSVGVYADGGSIDAVLGDGTQAQLGGGFASAERAREGGPIGQLKAGFGSLDLYPEDDSRAREFIRKACEK